MSLDAIIKAGSIVTAIGGIGAGLYALDTTYARHDVVSAIEQRLQQKIVSDRYLQLQQVLWRFQDRYGQNCERGDQAVREQCRVLFQQLQEAQQELEAIKKGGGQ